MASHPRSWTVVGVPIASENQRWRTGWKGARDMRRIIISGLSRSASRAMDGGWYTLRATMKAIRVSHTGGTEVLQYVDVATPQPGPGEALVKMEAIGVNFIDVYHRTGLYKLPLPFTPGSEGAGVVEPVG